MCLSLAASAVHPASEPEVGLSHTWTCIACQRIDRLLASLPSVCVGGLQALAYANIAGILGGNQNTFLKGVMELVEVRPCAQ